MKVRYTAGGFVNPLDAIAEARKQIAAVPRNTVVIITKTITENPNPTYDVYAMQGVLEAGQIRES
jgi:hypothetical protein